MKHNRLAWKLLPCAAILFALPGLASAGAWSLSGVPATGPVGGGLVTPDVLVQFTGDGTTNDAQTALVVPAGFSATAVGSNGGACPVVAGQVNVTSSTGATIPAGPTTFCTVTFTALPATVAGPYNIVTGANPATGCFDAVGDDITTLPVPLTCTPIANGTGALVVSAGPTPALSSAPTAPGGTITIVDTIGGGATTATLTITNSGQVGSTLNVGAPSGLSGVSSISPAAVQAIAQGSAGTTYTISCAAVAAATVSQVLSFTHDGTAPASPVTYNVDCTGVTGPTPPTASLGAATQPSAGVIGQVATGSVPVNVDSAGVAAASLALTCTIPATGASNFLVTSGGTRTITAPATVGANAPVIGVSCVRQAAAVSATLSCAQNATPDPDPAALTVQIDCPAGQVAPNFVSSPAPGGTITATGATGDTVGGSLGISNSAGTAPLTVGTCTASAGFTITSPVAFPLVIPAGGNSAVAFTCVAPGAGVTTNGTLACTQDAPNAAADVSYVLACAGVSGVIPTMGNAGKILLVSLMIGLGLLGMGLRRQA